MEVFVTTLDKYKYLVSETTDSLPVDIVFSFLYTAGVWGL